MGSPKFRLTSTEVSDGARLDSKFEFRGFGCSGQGRSPALSWSDPPRGTRSYAVTVYDPDAPTGSGWWHWVVVNIPSSVNNLKGGAGEEGNAQLPLGAEQVRNDFSSASWGGVCPPPGDSAHRYVFTVFALKTDRLDLPREATAALAGFMINSQTIGKATMTVTYGR
nr:YbhB/YbcL family Raf kinase inhibitor-like protein [Rhizobacter sp. Root404]